MEEKLVEEIAREVFFARSYDGDDWGNAKVRAGRIITRIGKAYADGELKIPGWQTIFRSMSCWQEDKDGTQILTDNAFDNGDYWLLRANDRGDIALRPLSGTGKEEE